MSWVGLILVFSLVDNVILSRLLGISPRAGGAGSARAAVWLGVSTAVLMGFSALVGWVIDAVVLEPLRLGFLRTPAFVLSVAGLTYLLEAAAARISPLLVRTSGFSLPGVAVNCATIGIVLLTTRGGYTAAESLIAGLAAGLGFMLVRALLAAISERLEIERIPRALRGFPLELISAGLMAYAFMAFDRAFLARILGG
ncbi:MAG TPA: Rnf-Nqr domain containing protein [Spirochaetia bacterium]|nr:Rnf-Nqr domain containing protein [Spirochaetia bacterium]